MTIAIGVIATLVLLYLLRGQLQLMQDDYRGRILSSAEAKAQLAATKGDAGTERLQAELATAEHIGSQWFESLHAALLKIDDLEAQLARERHDNAVLRGLACRAGEQNAELLAVNAELVAENAGLRLPPGAMAVIAEGCDTDAA